MFRRFLLYGVIGWAAEVLFTGTSAVVQERDRGATAKTYLWMHPIYGAGGLLLEWLSRMLAGAPRPVRAAAYVPAIMAIEYATGFTLRRALGRCPWDYEDRGFNLHGLVRLDYAPAWLVAGYLFEPVSDAVREITRPPSTVQRLLSR